MAHISAVPCVIDQVDHHNMIVGIVAAAIYFIKVVWICVALTEPAQNENKDDTVHPNFFDFNIW